MKRMVGILVVMFVFSFGLIKIGTAETTAQGDLDGSFGAGGIVSTDLGAFDVATDVLIQNDGKIIALGGAYDFTNEFFVVRYENDGTIDTSFGTAGILETTNDFSGNGIGGVLVANGKLLITGSGLSSGGDLDFLLARYDENGVLDTTFGVSGYITTSVSSDDDEGQDVQVAADGKIVVTGSSGSGIAGSGYAIVRYNSDGSLDTTLNSSGIITGSHMISTGTIVMSDSKIIITGRNNMGDFVTTRYNADGSLDTGFDGDGTVNTSGFMAPWDIVVQSDGKVVVVGTAFDAMNISDHNMAVVRYLDDGSLDDTFGINGVTLVDFPRTVAPSPGNEDFDEALGVDLLPNGKIIVTGYASTDSGGKVVVLQINTDGSLDTGFSDDGIATIDNGGRGQAVTSQVDGKIVVAGLAGGDFLVSRFLGIEFDNFIYLPIVLQQ